MVQLPFIISQEKEKEIQALKIQPLGKAIDLTGQTFHRLTVLGKASKPGEKTKWYAICSCPAHTICVVRGDALKSGHTRSCGCYNLELTKQKGLNNKKDISNQIFNFIKVLDATDLRDEGSIVYNCQCLKCGKKFQNCARNIVHGIIKSCGCLRNSAGEEKIIELLTQANISFVKEKTFNSCRYSDSKGIPRFDFYVNNQYLIEYDGEQHFRQTGWRSTSVFERQAKDRFKTEWCIQNNIPLIRIPYTHLMNLTIDDLKLETSKFICLNKGE